MKFQRKFNITILTNKNKYYIKIGISTIIKIKFVNKKKIKKKINKTYFHIKHKH